MRKLRLRAGEEVQMAYYRVNSSIVGHEAIFGPAEKDHLLHLVTAYATFGGLTVVECKVSRDHFDLLLGVPRRPNVLPTDEELLTRLSAIYKPSVVNRIRLQLATMRAAHSSEALEALRESYFQRMWKLSDFMQVIKQCFSQWFNARHEREGALWSTRFWSELFEQEHGAGTKINAPFSENCSGRHGFLASHTRPVYPRIVPLQIGTG